ncbi:hypothetical protein TNCV_5050681 [Trichonephila clavipes]|nr:hypothetical protein TNCV_5050681 [Trichonephila clavipes]
MRRASLLRNMVRNMVHTSTARVLLPQNVILSQTKLRGATAKERPRPTVPISVFVTLDSEVLEQMFRSSSQSEAKPPLFSSQAKAWYSFYRLTEGLSRLCPPCGVEARYATT